jgi:hypothetical protein
MISGRTMKIMQKILIATMLLPTLSAIAAKTIICPSATEVNRIFHDCKINMDKQSCGATYHNVAWVLDSPVESIYGGEHRFTGFEHLQLTEILSGTVVCKYQVRHNSQQMGWILGSRNALEKNCHLQHARSVLGISNCENADPKKCAIVCN